MAVSKLLFKKVYKLPNFNGKKVFITALLYMMKKKVWTTGVIGNELCSQSLVQSL